MTKKRTEKSADAARLEKTAASAVEQFFAHMAATCNVSASCKIAGLDSWHVYIERRRSASFREKWLDAIAAGYARLEAEMVSDALIKPSGKVSPTMQKSRDQKDRIRLSLLAMHRGSARGTPPVESREGTARSRMRAKLATMRQRQKAQVATA
jgi:hypothetical protein